MTEVQRKTRRVMVMLLQDLELEVEEQEGNRGGLQDFFLKKAN